MDERQDRQGGQGTLQDVITISPDVVFRDLDGEAVLLNLETGTYFGLNEVGTRMWNLLQQHSALQRVFENMQEEYEVAPEVLEQDLLRLVGQLCAQGLIRVARP